MKGRVSFSGQCADSRSGYLEDTMVPVDLTYIINLAVPDKVYRALFKQWEIQTSDNCSLLVS